MKNNINIKSKKTRTLNKQLVFTINDRFDPVFASIYCLLASKRTEQLSKNDFKRKLAHLYDARAVVSSDVRGNKLVIRYTLVSILDQFLPEPISGEAEQLFADIQQTRNFTAGELEEVKQEMILYLSQFKDNKQNIANIELRTAITKPELKIPLSELEQFYRDVTHEQLITWLDKLVGDELRIDFNNGEESLQLPIFADDYQPNQFESSESIEIDQQLDQAYLALAYSVDSPNRTTANIANSIFGGGVYSKLFKEVRERLSLSYNIRSELSEDNLLLVHGGVNNEKIELALSEIKDQLTNLQAGQFDEEFKLAKTNYLENIKRSKSSELFYINYYTSKLIRHSDREIDQLETEVEQVTKEQVLALFNSLEQIGQVIVK